MFLHQLPRMACVILPFRVSSLHIEFLLWSQARTLLAAHVFTSPSMCHSLLYLVSSVFTMYRARILNGSA